MCPYNKAENILELNSKLCDGSSTENNSFAEKKVCFQCSKFEYFIEKASKDDKQKLFKHLEKLPANMPVFEVDPTVYIYSNCCTNEAN